MAKEFKLTFEDGSVLFYDPHQAKAYDAQGVRIPLTNIQRQYHQTDFKTAIATHPDHPVGKSKTIKVLKISLGFKCNYSCSYCSQSVARGYKEANPTINRIDNFLLQLKNNLEIPIDGKGIKFELWGGEPFVYWQGFKYLGEQLRLNYPHCELSVVTNGTLLDDEKIDWLDKLGFSVAISHDGPGQHIRGKDPLDDPKIRGFILKLVERFTPLNRFNFNCVLTKDHHSVYEVHSYISKKLGYSYFPISTEGVVSVYDSGAQSFSLEDFSSMKPIWNRVFQDTITLDEYHAPHLPKNWTYTTQLRDFFGSLEKERPAEALGQKCGMDKEDRMAIDLDGNVLTCQNVSAKDGHKIGNVTDLENVKLTTSKHWKHHDNCNNCPVLQLCKGSCMYLDGDKRKPTCDAHFAFNFGLLASAFFILTNKKLKKIEGERVRVKGLTELEF